MMPMTRPTPAASPSDVKMVRPKRLRSSLKTYPIWNMDDPRLDGVQKETTA
jgi:hypothetical protein